jgi:hypothetical protein
MTLFERALRIFSLLEVGRLAYFYIGTWICAPIDDLNRQSAKYKNAI